jgi:hypothetical protein
VLLCATYSFYFYICAKKDIRSEINKPDLNHNSNCIEQENATMVERDVVQGLPQQYSGFGSPKGTHFQDLIKDPNCEIIMCSRNVRGEYLVQLRNNATGDIFTFGNVNPTHIPPEVRERLNIDVGTVVHLPLNEVLSNTRYYLAHYHRNFRGDYTLVFMDSITGMGITYANVNPEHIPSPLREYCGIVDTTVKHVHLQDILKDVDRYELVKQHPNPQTYTLVFKDKTSDHMHTFSNVRLDHIPPQIRQRLSPPGQS